MDRAPHPDPSHQNEHHDDHQAAMAELLDLDAEVLHAYLDEVMGWVASAVDRPPERVLDLGAGTGTATLALARRFPTARLIALDISEPMLQRLRAAARQAGLEPLVDTVQADLDAGWPDVADLDLVWAATSLHHVRDPERVLTEIRSALRPGALLAVTEMDATPRYLPDDLGVGRPGLELRLQAAVDALPSGLDTHPDWGPALERTGFTLVERRRFRVDPPAQEPATGRFVRSYLRWVRPFLDETLAADDLATVDLLLAEDGPHSLLHRRDLSVRGTHTGWLARP